MKFMRVFLQYFTKLAFFAILWWRLCFFSVMLCQNVLFSPSPRSFHAFFSFFLWSFVEIYLFLWSFDEMCIFSMFFDRISVFDVTFKRNSFFPPWLFDRIHTFFSDLLIKFIFFFFFSWFFDQMHILSQSFAEIWVF